MNTQYHKASSLLSRREAADFLGIKQSTLAVWHSTCRYPLPVIKVGRLARYRREDLERFLDQQTISHSLLTPLKTAETR